MMNLKILLKQPLQVARISKWIPVAIIFLALVGFSDATFLTVKHFQGIIPPCSIGGCETVLTSSYSVIFGIPAPFLGSTYYFIILLSLFLYFDSKKEIFLRFVLGFSVFGFVFSLYFISIMAFVLHALCEYCALSAFTSISIFIIAVYAGYKNYKKYE